ncbi:hypothetical protein [Roseobacter weihaiensis]|uniref:hypothetical protein n=1 Tax=Roseobacter weihaiensis TaxID=2763262 RepID=UPI001D0B874A|nr:hypothetical protein [Roseobacter sp. H9]
MAENVANELLLENMKSIRDELAEMREEIRKTHDEMLVIKVHLLGLTATSLTREIPTKHKQS